MLARLGIPMERYWKELPSDVDMFDYANDFVATTLLHDVPVINENREVVWSSLEEPYFGQRLSFLSQVLSQVRDRSVHEPWRLTSRHR